MKVKSLHIYPIKGLAGIELQKSNILERGMQYDRRWMLVDDDGLFISQRHEQRISLFKCSIDDRIHVAYQGSSISFDFDECSDVKILTTVWEKEVYAYEVSHMLSQWFTTQLNISCRLVRMVDEYDLYKELIKGPKQTRVSFADGYPYLIVGTASLDELSKRLGKEIPANRFRANIIVSTSTPHEEDKWNLIDIGTSKLQVIKPCSRCLVINIDQTSAEVKKQPLKELSKYRNENNTVNFGANTISIKEGVIKVGDILNIID